MRRLHNVNMTLYKREEYWITDEIKEINGILFVEAKARISNNDSYAEVNAQAGIDINQKGMSISQCFGASSIFIDFMIKDTILLIKFLIFHPDIFPKITDNSLFSITLFACK